MSMRPLQASERLTSALSALQAVASATTLSARRGNCTCTRRALGPWRAGMTTERELVREHLGQAQRERLGKLALPNPLLEGFGYLIFASHCGPTALSA
jgi:hypothetical protein